MILMIFVNKTTKSDKDRFPDQVEPWSSIFTSFTQFSLAISCILAVVLHFVQLISFGSQVLKMLRTFLKHYNPVLNSSAQSVFACCLVAVKIVYFTKSLPLLPAGGALEKVLPRINHKKCYRQILTETVFEIIFNTNNALKVVLKICVLGGSTLMVIIRLEYFRHFCYNQGRDYLR